MISHKHKYIFIHIPKTGGSSIESALLKHEGYTSEQAMDPFNLIPNAKRKKLNLYKSRQHKKLAEYRQALQKNYFCFAFVRNPWDIWISEFHYMRRQKAIPFSMSFEDYSDNPKYNDYHLESQFSFINDRIDFVGRFENFEKDCQKLSALLNLPLDVPHLNKSVRSGNYQHYYTPQARDNIENIKIKGGRATGSFDAKIFGYVFD